jgi:hypothetical protein
MFVLLQIKTVFRSVVIQQEEKSVLRLAYNRSISACVHVVRMHVRSVESLLWYVLFVFVTYPIAVLLLLYLQRKTSPLRYSSVIRIII